MSVILIVQMVDLNLFPVTALLLLPAMVRLVQLEQLVQLVQREHKDHRVYKVYRASQVKVLLLILQLMDLRWSQKNARTAVAHLEMAMAI
jgi:hypothetical protein